MDPFNALSTAATTRKIPPLIEASPTKIMLSALITSTDLQKDLDAAKEVTGGAGVQSAKMASRSVMVCGQSVPRYEGQSPPARQGSPCTQGHGMRLTPALSPHPTIGKEHRSVMPTYPTMGILTPRKVNIEHQLVVHSSSNDDDVPLVKHDTRIDLNPGGARICYTQEPALGSDTFLSSPPPYIVLGQRVGV
jgi:hypothetical protein